MQTAIVIPARLASTRLPRKLLLRETGKTLIEHTYRAAEAAKLATEVIVAADDPEIAQAVQSFGGNVVMTRPDHVCGTDRVAEVAAALDCDLIVNLQGDEPEIDPDAIDLVIQLLQSHPHHSVATLATPIVDRVLLEDPACVKVVFNEAGEAMYFSRSVIPHPRDWQDEWLQHHPPVFWQHVGLYGYRREYLLKISQQPAVPIETLESLEQLRILYSGQSILVGQVSSSPPGVDTLEDYSSFVSRAVN